MAKISLRAYNREIEKLIESGRIDEAVAHCRQILNVFPKHVDTYRLLGKALMESQRYSDASDILQRLLSSVPDDFVSHVGMSIIREDEGNLDESIWHMERAFEVQPANSAIQDELRRLYARRDGIAPPKIRLTRGALARMYARGDLLQQSIAEIRTALAEDPQRLDLQLLLGSVYYRAGQKIETAEVLNSLLRKLPYCLEANMIMAALLSNTERSQETLAYSQRVQALDPYAAHVSQTAPTPDLVPEQAVTLEKLDWKPDLGGPGGTSQPAWAASLGVDVEDFSSGKEALPEWLQSSAEQSSESGPSTSPEFPFKTETEAAETPDWLSGAEETKSEESETAIPEWMQAAGWAPSSGEAGEGAQDFPSKDEPETPSTSDSNIASEDIAQAEIPDWLRAMAPEAGFETEEEDDGEVDEELLSWLPESQPAEDSGEQTPAWLSTGSEEEAQAEPAAASREEPSTEEILPEIPDLSTAEWLQELEQEEAPTGAVVFSEQQEEEIEGNEQLPDWLSGLTPSDSKQEAAPAEMPDWLKEFQTTGEGESENTQVSAFEEEQEEETEEVGLPDWLRDTQATESAESSPEDEQADEGETGAEGLPEWLRESSDEERVATESVEETLSEIQPEEEAEPAEIPDWLHPSQMEIEEPADIGPVEEIPDWLKETSQPEKESEELADTKPVRVSFVQSQPSQADTLPSVPEGREETFGLQGVEEEASDTDETIPSWLKGVGEQIPEEDLSQAETLVSRPVELEETSPESMQISLESSQAETVPSRPDELEPSQAETIPSRPVDLGIPEETTEPTPAEEEQELATQESAVTESSGAGAAVSNAAEMNADDAFAWLESLAVKQGADEALLLSPEERRETPPDWVKQATEENLTQTSSDQEAPEKTSGEAPEQPESEEAVPELKESLEEQAPDWSLKAEAAQAAVPEETEIPVPEMETSGEEVTFEVVTPTIPEMESREEETGGEEALLSEEEPPASSSTVEPAEGRGQMDADEAFAWLESLAVKQGADEALLLSPDERRETPPDWVHEEGWSETDQQEETVEEEPLARSEAFEAEVIPEGEELYAGEELPSEEGPAEEGSSGKDLISIEEGEILSERKEIEADVVPDQVEAPVEEPASLADVSQVEFKEGDTKPTQINGMPAEESELSQEWQLEAEASQAAVPQEETQTPPEAEYVQEETTETPTASQELEARPAGVEEPVESQAVELPELPDWLAGAVDEEQAEEAEWTPPVQQYELNQASLSELERLPGVGFRLAQSIVNYRETQGSFQRLDDLLKIPGFDAGLLEDLRRHLYLQAPQEPQPEPVVTQAPAVTPAGTASLESSQPQGEAAQEVLAARNTLFSGQIPEGVEQYTRLIKNRQHLEQVIQDLNEGLNFFPEEVTLWQALGDAYLRNNQIQRALEAYSRAEELLR